MDKIIWIVYRESDAHNFAAFHDFRAAKEYKEELIAKDADGDEDYYIDEITLFDRVPNH